MLPTNDKISPLDSDIRASIQCPASNTGPGLIPGLQLNDEIQVIPFCFRDLAARLVEPASWARNGSVVGHAPKSRATFTIKRYLTREGPWPQQIS